MIHIKDTKTMKEKTIIRAYGNDIQDTDVLYSFISNELEMVPDRQKNSEWLINSLGGGTLILSNKRSVEKKIQIFGKSSQYGEADHKKTEEILAQEYTDFKI